MARSLDEAGPQTLAWKLLTWLYARGYELPGNKEDWYLLKPAITGSRRSKWDTEAGVMAWYLSYEGEDEEAKHWSGTFGGELPPTRVINHLSEVEIKEKKDYSGKYPRTAGYELAILGGEDEDGRRVTKRKQKYYIWKCKCCGYRMEEKKDNAANYQHRKCGAEGQFEVVDTITVEE